MSGQGSDQTALERKLATLRQMAETLRTQGASLDPETLRRTLAPILEQIAELEGQLTHIETSGGTAVRDVMAGRDFVGRDKWEVVLGDRHEYHGVPPDQLPAEVLEEAYLRHLCGMCDRLQLSAVDPKYVSATGESRIPLAAVYTELDVVAPPSMQRGRRGVVELEALLRGEEGREPHRLPALRAIAAEDETRFVLLGDPGSGKSTFVDYLAFALAQTRLDPEGEWARRLEEGGWPHGPLLPVRLVLRDFAARGVPAGARRGTADMVWSFIRHELDAHLPGASAYFPHLQRTLLQEGGLILFDGLDEVPDAERLRQRVKEAIADFAAPLTRCRLVVTCRPYAYRDPAWQLDGFRQITLAPFNEEQINTFIDRWYQAVAPFERWDQATAAMRARKLRTAVRLPHLQELASRPLLLTLMATLHTAWGTLPEDRADLYAACVKLLLDHWQQSKVVVTEDGEEQVEGGLLTTLGISEETLAQALHRVAFEAHERQGQEPERGEGVADIREGDLLAALAPVLGEGVNPRVVIHYIETRAGLLMAKAPGVYAFPHRSFQEYLAACHLSDQEDFATRLATLVRDDPAWWREVYLLAVGKAKRGGLSNAVALVNALCPRDLDRVRRPTATDWRAATLAGQALVELRLAERAAGQPHFEAVLERVQEWLVAASTRPDALKVAERAEAGTVLGQLGDPRFDPDAWHLPRDPDRGFVHVPAGPFVMGSREGEDPKAFDDEYGNPSQVDLPYDFWIARYPVTNAQYAHFVASGSYDDPTWWTPLGWQWRQGEYDSQVEEEWLRDWLKRRPPERRHRPMWWDEFKERRNHPVVGVSWFEAVAYTRWLTAMLRQGDLDPSGVRSGWLAAIRESAYEVRLPTEAEWEKATRGTAGRRWPWGDEDWNPEWANVQGTIGTTTAVGIYPLGATPEGVHDLAGNVWEWTHTLYRDYPYDPGDGREDEDDPGWRVVRGGSWINPLRIARCACRDLDPPDNFDINLGFRVVVAPALAQG